MSTETLILGVLLVVCLVVAARVFRKGLGTFDQHFKDFRRALDLTEKQVRDGNLSISLHEQMAVIRAAIAEELELEGNPAGYYIDASPKLVCLHTPRGSFEILFHCKTTRLHTQNRVLRGGGQWILHGPDTKEVRTQSLGQAMQHMRRIIQGQALAEEEGEEFRRRFSS